MFPERNSRSTSRRALERRLEAAESMAEQLDSLLGRTLERFGEVSRKRALAQGRHPGISFPRTDFLVLLRLALRLLGDAFTPDVWCSECEALEVGSAPFVDVGSGVGDKVVLASDLGFEAHGIEVDPTLVRRARRTFRLRLAPSKRASAEPASRHAADFGLPTIALADALEADFTAYRVIYFFRPFADDRLQRRLEQRIWKQAPPGAFVIACASVTKPPRRFQEIDLEAALEGVAPPVDARVYRARTRVPEA